MTAQLRLLARRLTDKRLKAKLGIWRTEDNIISDDRNTSPLWLMWEVEPSARLTDCVIGIRGEENIDDSPVI
jgi:hypothetical protein